MYWNVLLRTTYHVVSLFGPMSTNYHKHEIETEMRLFCFSFSVFSVILFLDFFLFGAVHKLCRLGREERVAPKTIYYIDLT